MKNDKLFKEINKNTDKNYDLWKEVEKNANKNGMLFTCGVEQPLLCVYCRRLATNKCCSYGCKRNICEKCTTDGKCRHHAGAWK